LLAFLILDEIALMFMTTIFEQLKMGVELLCLPLIPIWSIRLYTSFLRNMITYQNIGVQTFDVFSLRGIRDLKKFVIIFENLFDIQ